MMIINLLKLDVMELWMAVVSASRAARAAAAMAADSTFCRWRRWRRPTLWLKPWIWQPEAEWLKHPASEAAAAAAVAAPLAAEEQDIKVSKLKFKLIIIMCKFIKGS